MTDSGARPMRPDDGKRKPTRSRPRHIDFPTLLVELENPAQRVTTSHVTALAGIGRTEINRLDSVWRRLPLDRRRQVLSSVVEIAEDNVEYDFSAFVEYCLGDEEAELRAIAAGAVEYHQGWRAGSRLLEMLRSDPSPNVRASAALSLGEFVLSGGTAMQIPRWLSGLVDTLISVVADPEADLGVRVQALVSVAAADDERVAPLIREFYSMPDVHARRGAVRAMGRSCDPVWTDEIVAQLSSRDTEMRYYAALSAADLAAPATLPAVARLISDPDVEVREAAIAALGEIGGPVAIRILRELAANAPEARRESIEDALSVALEGEDPLGVHDLHPLPGQRFTAPPHPN